MPKEWPKGSPQREKIKQNFERNQVANQVKRAREHERIRVPGDPTFYSINRNRKEYLIRLGGLRNFFEYVKSLRSNKVLDIGAGAGEGARVLSEMPITKGIDLHVTTLQATTELRKNFPKEKIHITSVENLRGIEMESLGAIIAVFSIGYSDQVQMAVKRMDEVLVPGGAIKATFTAINRQASHRGLVSRDPEIFIKQWHSLGYNVYVKDQKYIATSDTAMFFRGQIVNQQGFLSSIVVAIKPGNPDAPKAEQLLEDDFLDQSKEAVDITEDGERIFNVDD